MLGIILLDVRETHECACMHPQVRAQLFGPPVFNPGKLTTTFLPGAGPTAQLDPRRYTLTHNDLTGQLALSIGAVYNTAQVSGWYTQLIR